MPTLKLYVRNLTERADERRLEQMLRALRGVYGVVASCDGRCLELDFEDDDVSIHHIIATVAAAGFDAQLVS